MGTQRGSSSHKSLAVLQHSQNLTTIFKSTFVYDKLLIFSLINRNKSTKHRTLNVKKHLADGTMPKSTWKNNPTPETPSVHNAGQTLGPWEVHSREFMETSGTKLLVLT